MASLMATALTLFWAVANMQQYAHLHSMGPAWPGVLSCLFAGLAFLLVPRS